MARRVNRKKKEKHTTKTMYRLGYKWDTDLQESVLKVECRSGMPAKRVAFAENMVWHECTLRYYKVKFNGEAYEIR